MRQVYTGKLCVYRAGAHRETLDAEVKLPDGRVFYYYNCPKCFLDVIPNGHDNVKHIKFTATNEGRNPRGVTIVKEG